MKQQNLHLHELWGMPGVDKLTLHLDRAHPTGLSDARVPRTLCSILSHVHCHVQLQFLKRLPGPSELIFHSCSVVFPP